MNTWKKLLSMLLVLAMLLVGPLTTGLSRAVAESDTTEQPATNKGRVLETEDLDPADFHINRLDNSERKPTVAEPEEVDPEKIVRVSIFLEGKSTIDEGFSTKGIAHNTRAVAYRRSLELQQATMQTKIEGAVGHALNVNANLTLLVNAISVDIPYKDIETIKAMPGVKSVEFENFYYAQEVTAEPNTSHTSEHMVGATDAWAAGYTGAGSKVAILDTGIDADHISFNEDAFLHAIEEVEESGKSVELMEQIDDETLAQLNAKKKRASLTAEETYLSAKIPFAFNYASNNMNVAHKDQASNHGSHVAGIAAANRYLQDGDGFKDAATNVYAVGMAPDAQLIVMDVFQASGGTTDSIYFLAIEDAIILGCDSANLSLGSPNPGFTYSNSYQDVLNRLASDSDIEMVVAISAGNAGAMTDNALVDLYIEDVSLHTGGTPGTFLNSLCVASADNVGTTGLPLTVGEHKFPFWETSGYGNPAIATIAGTHDFVYIDGIGEEAEYAEVNAVVPLEGKIVITNRGSISFYVKGNNAKRYNPKAVLVANNAPGQINMNLQGFTGRFPMVSFGLADANWIKANSPSGTTENYTYYTGSITIPNDTDYYAEVTGTREEATVSDFSSWGIPGSLIMKPEITAPGGNIWSVNGTSTASSDAGTGIDRYVSYSGTSMAAPHIAGLTAVLAQYFRENPIENEALTGNYSMRAILQSLLMSTATPMMNGENYYSILQQGAGLVEVGKAISAPSVIMMDDAYLTTATKSDADGKVKVELGDDPEKTGEYTYKFTVYNNADVDLEYKFDTKMFTQDYYVDEYEDIYMDQATAAVDATDSYLYEGMDGSHDVNKDGATDKADAQAILDYLTGNVAGSALNLDVADMDGDKKVTSYDAELLLHYEAPQGMVVDAHGSKQVTVKIKLNDTLDDYPNGAYLEGYTYVTCITDSDEEGVDYAHEHTIPILGFFGDYTDPSMFDCVTDNEMYYGMTDKIPYCIEYVKDSQGNIIDVRFHTSGYTSWMINGEENFVYSSNPYTEEDLFYEDRLATRSDATVGKVYYNLIRNAGTGGYALAKVDGYGGDVIKVLDAKVKNLYEEGLFYYESQGAWEYNKPNACAINKSLSGFDLKDGDTVRVAYYALPEYVAMKYNEDLTGTYSGMITDDGMFADLIESNELGRGMYVGYDFLVDNTAPEIGEITLDDETGKMTIEVSDNNRVAYVGLLSVDGDITYLEAYPGEKETVAEVDATPAIEEALTYVAVVAGDYAGNTVVKAAKVNNIDYVWETAYVLTDEFIDGGDYVILNSDQLGTANSVNISRRTMNVYSLTVGTTTVLEGNEGTEGKPYTYGGVSAWTNVGNKLKAYDRFLRVNVNPNNGAVTLQASTTDDNNVWTWSSENHTLSMNVTVGNAEKTYYLGITTEAGNRVTITEDESNLYLYRKLTYKVPVDVDPYKVTDLWVEPEELALFVSQEAILTTSVTPLTADPSATWESSDPTVATVDENGKVTAIGVGEAIITATSVSTPEMSATVHVTVSEPEAVDLKGIVWDESAQKYFAAFNSNEPENWTKLHEQPLDAEDLKAASFIINDEGGLDLFAASYKDDNTASTLYKVDRSNYSLQPFAEGNPVRDMAMTNHPDWVAGILDGDLWFLPMVEENSTEAFVGSGFRDQHVDGEFVSVAGYILYLPTIVDQLGEDVADGYAVWYFILDENGNIYDTLKFFTKDGERMYYFWAPELIASTEIAANAKNDDLYHAYPIFEEEDGEQALAEFAVCWSHYNEDLNSSEVILVDGLTGACLRAGKNFGDNVWPVVGLFDDSFVEDPEGNNKLSDEMMTILKGRLEKMTLAKEENCARRVPSVESEELEAEPVGEAGGTNAIRGAYEKKLHRKSETRKVDGTSEDGVAFITLSEDKATTNGFFTVKYDPKQMTYVSVETIKEYKSFKVDEKNGEIKFAYATMEPIPAKETIANFKFKVIGNSSEVTVTTSERNDELGLNETSSFKIKGDPKPAYVEIDPKDVEFVGETPYVVYNGKAQTPGYIVKDEKGNIIPASKYTAKYAENTKAGTGYVLITFPDKEYMDCRTWFKIYLPATTWTKVENVETGIKISWTKVEGAAGYVVYRRAWNLKDAGWTTFERWNNTTATSWIDTKVYAGTRYQYGVKAYFAKRTDPISNKQIGGGVGDNYNLGLVGPLKTTVRITTRTLNSVTPGSKKLTVKWSGSSVFTGYQVQVATDAKFTQNLKTVTINDPKTYEKTISGLNAKTTYYVRVRSIHVFEGTTYYGGWSNVMNAKTK